MTTREKLERKLEKRREWSRGAAAESRREFEKSEAAVSGIPFGQPNINGCLTGAINRSNSAMARSCEAVERAEYHASKARGIAQALKNSIYSDDTDAAEKLAEKIARLEELQDAMRIAGKIARSKKLTEAEKREQIITLTGWSDADFVRACYDNISTIIANGGCPTWAMSNNSAEIRRGKLRLEEVKARAARSEAAENAENGVTIENTSGGWSVVTFAEKPAREILEALKAAGFRWRGGSWRGSSENLPECVRELVSTSDTSEAAKLEPIRGILIDPEAETVEEVTIPVRDDDGEPSYLDGTCSALKCRVVDCVRHILEGCTPSGSSDDVWVDDDGIANTFGWALTTPGVRYGGRGLILGYVPETGACKSHTLTSEDVQYIREHVRWMNVD